MTWGAVKELGLWLNMGVKGVVTFARGICLPIFRPSPKKCWTSLSLLLSIDQGPSPEKADKASRFAWPVETLGVIPTNPRMYQQKVSSCYYRNKQYILQIQAEGAPNIMIVSSLGYWLPKIRLA